MPHPLDRFKPSKGSMIVLVLAVTLILGLALPRKEDPVVQKPVSFQIDSEWNAVVKRSEVSIGESVDPGTVVLVLTDPKLEAEIRRLEEKLKAAQLETMEAVAEPGMLGGIGSIPRIIWETPAEESAPIALPQAEPTSRVTKKVVTKDLSKFEIALKSSEKELANREAEIKEAADALKQIESGVSAAQTNFDESNKEHAKMQKLYDLGAIPKKQLDESASIAEVAGIALNDAKQKLSEASSKQEKLEKQAVDLRARAALAREELNKARIPTEVEVVEQTPTPTKEITQRPRIARRAVKKVVYGSAPTGFAPVKVNLVEDETPNETQQIEAIRTKLLGLKAKRELLKIRALRAGRVRWIAEKESKVAPGDPLIEIEY